MELRRLRAAAGRRRAGAGRTRAAGVQPGGARAGRGQRTAGAPPGTAALPPGGRPRRCRAGPPAAAGRAQCARAAGHARLLLAPAGHPAPAGRRGRGSGRGGGGRSGPADHGGRRRHRLPGRHRRLRASPDAIAQRARIREQWSLPAGRRFTEQAWDSAKSDALRELVARRYPAGRVGFSRADIDAATQRARLGLRLDSGPLFRLGPDAGVRPRALRPGAGAAPGPAAARHRLRPGPDPARPAAAGGQRLLRFGLHLRRPGRRPRSRAGAGERARGAAAQAGAGRRAVHRRRPAGDRGVHAQPAAGARLARRQQAAAGPQGALHRHRAVRHPGRGRLALGRGGARRAPRRRFAGHPQPDHPHRPHAQRRAHRAQRLPPVRPVQRARRRRCAAAAGHRRRHGPERQLHLARPLLRPGAVSDAGLCRRRRAGRRRHAGRQPQPLPAHRAALAADPPAGARPPAVARRGRGRAGTRRGAGAVHPAVSHRRRYLGAGLWLARHRRGAARRRDRPGAAAGDGQPGVAAADPPRRRADRFRGRAVHRRRRGGGPRQRPATLGRRRRRACATAARWGRCRSTWRMAWTRSGCACTSTSAPLSEGKA